MSATFYAHKRILKASLLCYSLLVSAVWLSAEGEASYGVRVDPQKARFYAMKTLDYRSPQGASVSATFDRHLDLDAQTKLPEYASIAPTVPLGPALVAGEGPDPGNATVVRAFSKYGLCEFQFLAFPPNVRGGVDVACGLDADKHALIAAAAFDREVNEVRLFDRYGIPKISIRPEFAGPYLVAIGNLDGGAGDEVVVAKASSSLSEIPVAFYDASGKVLGKISVKRQIAAEERGSLSVWKGAAFLFFSSEKIVWKVALSGSEKSAQFNGASELTGCAPSAFTDDGFLGFEKGSVTSVLVPFGGKRNEPMVASARENIFWLAPQRAWGQKNPSIHWDDKIATSNFIFGKYIRRGEFQYLRIEKNHDFMDGGRFESTDDYGQWTSGKAKEFRDNSLSNYTLGEREPYVEVGKLWEVAISHRWEGSYKTDIGSYIDQETGLPKYMVLDRRNAKPGYAEGKNQMQMVTYNYFDLPYLRAQSIYLQRGVLRQLAPLARKRPDLFVGLEPSHEAEIVTEAQGNGSLGDYNPSSIRLFFEYLMQFSGSLDKINERYGTGFTPGFFDAPRNMNRGKWDSYSTDNRYFLDWMVFNNRTIERMVASGYREGLMAGFAPETISCHQIPSIYIGKDLTAFSAPATRTTPIDWMLTSGTSFGFTRYGVWYNKPDDAIYSSWSSGFGMTTLGEYAAKSADPEVCYQQIKTLQNSGASFVHHMAWDPTKWKGENQAALEGCN